MNTLTTSDIFREKIIELIRNQIQIAPGRKILEFGSLSCTIAEDILQDCDYLALTDKSTDFIQIFNQLASNPKIQLIADSELEEDCYFGRFHLAYTLFGFRGLPHLVDEIMRVRRLILKGGNLVICDLCEDDSANQYIKQLKRCGFEKITQESFSAEGKDAFLLIANK